MKNNYTKILFSFVLILPFLSIKGYAQNGEGGTPPSFKFENRLKTFKQPVVVPLDVDVDVLKKEDAITNKDAMPLRIAHKIHTDIKLSANNDWVALPDGQLVWQKTLSSPNANGIILSFDELSIPEGGKLFIYTADKLQVVGAYTNSTNPGGGRFASPTLFQDKIVLEYVPSELSDQEPIINISALGYVYNMKTQSGVVADDFSCYININCSEGDNWQKQRNGVVAMEMEFSDGWYICSGSLINNVRQDKTPYILTAEHCVIDGADQADNSTLKFIFFYDKPGCTSIEDYTYVSSTAKTLVGADLLVDVPYIGGSDGVLFKLKQNIPSDWNVYYNGWDATGAAATSGVGIHHPNGFVKTISAYTQTLQSDQYESGRFSTVSDGHWRVYWVSTANGRSVTFGGSSGSPLFSTDGLIVGTLTGGGSLCQTPNYPDYYGKMSYHFNGKTNTALQMKTYLDPDNTGITKLSGYDPISGIEQEIVRKTESVVIFPNPISDNLNISANQIIRAVKVFDLSGKIVAQISDYTASTVSFPSSSWSNGVYSVLITTELGTETYKVIK